ncbi:adenylyl-sulfate kinase [Saccharothrix australiensis]|uniref:Adenylyl-sulfate kinase n=1 Tax=Saccharothrix australiensis TaxID=2072 RepID=A0A495VYL2_9PSEU|nr:adenylyl-sulfate kinase [Saccharothrix australiensis]RKT53837.1 adenylylsulfate kinase /sulfate adenylyltransferase subunit 1 [Saccharothrix australiensis]
MTAVVDPDTGDALPPRAGTADRDLLRLVACGGVGDGKRTLLGRLLYEAGAAREDRLAAVRADAAGRGGGPDYALLLDGPAAERERGDVVHRRFATATREFVVADVPGRERRTGDLVAGASTADVALIVVDARKSLPREVRGHTHLAALLGVGAVVVAVTKVDLVDYGRAAHERISHDYREFARRLGLTAVEVVPTCAPLGDNVGTRSARMPWYEGPALLELLESFPATDRGGDRCFRLPVRYVNQVPPDFRGCCGRITSGAVRPGDPVLVLPGGQRTAVTAVHGGEDDEAVAGESVTVTVADDVDVARGDLLCDPESPAEVTDGFQAHLVWLHEEPMFPGRRYAIRIGARLVRGSVRALRHRLDVDTLDQVPAAGLACDDLGLVDVEVDQPVALDRYQDDRRTGAFLVLDPVTNATVGAGMVRQPARPGAGPSWQRTDVGKAARRLRNGHRPGVVWLTGLSGSGKSTIANLLEQRLHARGVHTYLLDGDNLRCGLNSDLGFRAADRVENIRRTAEVARLMVDAGLVVLVACISPFAADRRLARALVAEGEFCEVHVDAPLEVAERRDPKGLYRRARRGEIADFTGIDSPYEPPDAPEVRIDTTGGTPEDAVAELLARLTAMGMVHS